MTTEKEFNAWFKKMKADLILRSGGQFTTKHFDRLFRAYAYVDFTIKGYTPQESANQYLIGL